MTAVALLRFLCACLIALSLCPRIHAADANIDFFSSAFLPQSVQIDPGDTVTWTRLSGTHLLTSGNPSAPAGSPDEAGTLFQVTLDASNPTFSYTYGASPTGFGFFDALNPGQVGFISVSDGSEIFVVTVLDNIFVPDELFIFAGDTVRWEHEPMEMLHTITSGLSSDPVDNPGALFDEESSDSFPIFEYEFNFPGTEDYFCRPHESLAMNARIHVQSFFIRGDSSSDGNIDLLDPIKTLGYLFLSENVTCLDAHDINDDGVVNIADALYSLGFLFSLGSEPPLPFPNAGADRTVDSLHCL